MKRWLLRLGLAAVTFTFGYGVYFFTQAVVIHNQQRSGPLPYCEVARNAEAYHDQEILVKARIFVDDSGVSVYEDCDPVEALAAGVAIEGNSVPNGFGSVDHLRLFDEKPNTQTADALIRGRFDAYASSGCYGPKFRIYAENIELLSSLTDHVPPQTEGPSLRLKH